MVSVDLKALLNRLNQYCTGSLEGAAGLCVSRTHYEVTVEHLFFKLAENSGSDIPLILHQFGIDLGTFQKELVKTIEDFRTGNAAKPVFSPMLMSWIQDAWLIASVELNESKIRSGAMLLAFLKQSERYAAGRYVDVLKSVKPEEVLAHFGVIVKSSVEQTVQAGKPRGEEVIAGEGTALGKFCTDFTLKAKNGEIDPVFGRDQEIRQIVDILARRRKNNPIVVGEPGVGKTAVVEGLALRIVENDVPDLLKDVSILGLDMGLLQAGAGVKGEFENRLKSVISEIKASPKPIILFIDEAHTIIGAGAQAGSGDAANLLKPALARGELRTIAATTWSEYKKYFEKDAALARRFQPVKLDEPSVDTAVLILRGLKEKYEQTHQVSVRDDAIVAAAELSDRYISGRLLPDKAVDLLDTAAARVKVLLTAKPDIIEDKERIVQAYQREKQALSRDLAHGALIDMERLSAIDVQLETINAELQQLTERWGREKELTEKLIQLRNKQFSPPLSDADQDETLELDALKTQIAEIKAALAEIQGDTPLIRVETDPDMVAKVVADWTGIPLGRVMRDEARNIINLEDNLKKRIKGQDTALEVITEGIKASKSGLKDPSQPMGVFLLVGPSGVGKTETGLAIADLLFGGERFMVSINMSEFQEKHTVSRLIGSPPGYVGYGEGGVLTEAVRQRPYSVVLLDEVEKADLEVMNLFYQVFDKGSLSDGEGRVIDFKNTVIFLTSNLATDVITEMCSADQKPDAEILTAAIRPVLSHHFKPALLARMIITPYFILDPAVMKEIVMLKMDKLAQRLFYTHKMKLTYQPDVIEQIAARCQEVETGARNIDHIMTGTIMPQMSKEILARMSEENMPSAVCLAVNSEGRFEITFDN